MKRPGWVILILILLGGWLLNVASGWVCELLPDMRSDPLSTYQSGPPSAAEVAWWGRHAQADWPKQPTRALRQSRIGIQHVAMVHDVWSPHPTAAPYGVSRHRAGWPFISMEGARWQDASGPSRLDARLSGEKQWLSLNLRPVWPGTFINTLFYALLLLGAYYVLGALRRRRRIRRGKCPSCAYDLRGGGHVVCPECGAGVTG